MTTPTRERTAIIAALLCILALGGCGVNPQVRTVATDDSTLIFGYLDMADAPYTLGCVRITQDEKAGIAYRQSCMTTLEKRGK